MMMDSNVLTKELLAKYLKENSEQLLDVLKNLDLSLNNDRKLASELVRMLIKDTMIFTIDLIHLDNLDCYVRDNREYAMQFGWNEAVDELNLIREAFLELLADEKN